MSTGNFKNTNNFGLGILAAIPDESERENLVKNNRIEKAYWT